MKQHYIRHSLSACYKDFCIDADDHLSTLTGGGMKVLQTLGAHGATDHVGIFQYRRFSGGIDLWPSYKQGGKILKRIIISHQKWQDLLDDIAKMSEKSLSLDSLKAKIYESLKGTTGLQKNHCPSIAAILEHEGSIDLYGSRAGAIILKPEK
jgi:hypothetical protein